MEKKKAGKKIKLEAIELPESAYAIYDHLKKKVTHEKNYPNRDEFALGKDLKSHKVVEIAFAALYGR